MIAKELDLDQWWAAGEQVELVLAEMPRRVFVRRVGSGPSLTMLHGFPSSSHDWTRVAPALAERRSLLMCDFLGFGASQKPRDHTYSIHEQADLVERLWAREGVSATTIVAHDYALSVAQELLARRGEGSLGVELKGVHLLNGGLYPELHRPQPTQTALRDPEQGPQVSALITGELFTAGLRPTFAPDFDAAHCSEEIWRAMNRDEGQLILHRLIGYMSDRDEHRDRWVAAIEQTDVPLAFVWGMLDPISGAHMAERIGERLPDAPLLALAEVSHWPALEAPQRVVAQILGE